MRRALRWFNNRRGGRAGSTMERHRRLGIRVGSAKLKARAATLELSTLVKSFGTRLSFQRAAGIMLLNVADCDCDFRNDYWPVAILMEVARGEANRGFQHLRSSKFLEFVCDQVEDEKWYPVPLLTCLPEYAMSLWFEVKFILIIVFVTVTPIGWFVSEFVGQRWLRMTLGIAAILSSFGVAYLVGQLDRLNSNSWFGDATQELITATVTELEAGNQNQVLVSLKRLQQKYQPSYENRARYDELVAETVKDMQKPKTP